MIMAATALPKTVWCKEDREEPLGANQLPSILLSNIFDALEHYHQNAEQDSDKQQDVE